MEKNRFFNGFFTMMLSIIIALIFVAYSSADTPITVIIDAGHGGQDGGAVGFSGTLEKDLNLDMALKLKELFEQAGYHVVMSRDSDSDTDSLDGFHKKKDIENRYLLSEKYNSSIYISIHMNSSTSERDKGFQVFYGCQNPKSKDLAQSIYDAIQTKGNVNRLREVKQAPSTVYLMKNVKTPAVLVECGFISNKEDEALLNNEDYRKEFAFVLYYGISEYLK